jgi:hypothetical protein
MHAPPIDSGAAGVQSPMARTPAPASRRRKSPPRLVRRVDASVWEIVGTVPGIPNRYHSRETAIRAIELTEAEKWQVHATAAARDRDTRVVTYDDVMWTLAARTDRTE